LKGIPQRRYTREFHQKAVKILIKEKLSLPEAARRLSLAPSTITYRVRIYKESKLGDIG
jgi:transposase-like protein